MAPDRSQFTILLYVSLSPNPTPPLFEPRSTPIRSYNPTTKKQEIKVQIDEDFRFTVSAAKHTQLRLHILEQHVMSRATRTHCCICTHTCARRLFCTRPHRHLHRSCRGSWQASSSPGLSSIGALDLEIRFGNQDQSWIFMHGVTSLEWDF